jgi:hypothetical protein
MKSRRAYAKQLFRLVLNRRRQRLGMPSDFNVERERAKFIAAIGDTDMTVIVRLAADLETHRVLRNTVAAGIVLSAEEKATFREMVQTATLDREAAMHGDLRATMPSSAAVMH